MSHKFDTYLLNSAISAEAIMFHEDHGSRWSGNAGENTTNFPQLQQQEQESAESVF